ncbi:unannotated protein [freshwater metagenome]|uniref:Unannotated protein n=1 Tax=freshwater metagenome TaxID=449393 RepID=A0A6J7IM52_9ZZZZ
MRRFAFNRRDLVFESLLFTSQSIALGLRLGDLGTKGAFFAVKLDQSGALGQRLASVTQLVSGGVVGLQVKEPLEICHLHSLTRDRPCCRIDQLAGLPRVVVVVVVDAVVVVDEVVVDDLVVLVPGRVVVVVAGFLVVVVVSSTVGSAPFRIP